MENLGERISLLSWLRYANLDQHRSPWMGRIRENVKEEEAKRESERERLDLDTSHIPEPNFIPKPMSVFPGTIRHKGSLRTLA